MRGATEREDAEKAPSWPHEEPIKHQVLPQYMYPAMFLNAILLQMAYQEGPKTAYERRLHIVKRVEELRRLSGLHPS